jgi:succinate dehydrogenase/fumarate reductase flavoprotein subunit
MEEELVKADVLCIGGGIAGLMAAIRATELGTKVVIAEKGNALHSGAGRAGNDHFETYIPEVHGPDGEAFIQELLRGQKGEVPLSHDIFRAQFAKAFDIVELWDSWGIPMKYKGRWEFAGHCFPGRRRTYLKYSGHMQKPVLVNQALHRGVEIMNRVMVFDLLRDGDAIIGAIGAGTREDKVVVFQAKAVILGTGRCSRLYPSLTPGWMFNDPHGGTQTGDGRAMAYRAGAKLQNVEMPQRHIGPKYLTRFGQATWVGVLKDPQGKPIGTFVTKPDRLHGDMVCEVNKLIPEQYARSGKGPVYMDCTEMTDEDYEYMMHWMVHEGNLALINHMKDEGIDVRKNLVEFMTYPIRCGGLIVTNAQTETNLKGLYAAGDEAVGGISAAATFGWIAGESAANYAQQVENPDVGRTRKKIEKTKELINQLRGQEEGPDWEETNIALQQVMYDYAGQVRNESLLRQGLSHLHRLREKTYTIMIARNPHELGRCLEVLNLFDIGELVFLMALDRKETRGLNMRPDYPFTNPLLSGLHIVQNIDGKPVIQWTEIGY